MEDNFLRFGKMDLSWKLAGLDEYIKSKFPERDIQLVNEIIQAAESSSLPILFVDIPTAFFNKIKMTMITFVIPHQICTTNSKRVYEDSRGASFRLVLTVKPLSVVIHTKQTVYLSGRGSDETNL